MTPSSTAWPPTLLRNAHNDSYLAKRVEISVEGGSFKYFNPAEAEDDNFIAEYNTVIEADRTLGINQSSIIKCCKGKQHSACGFKWMYKEDYEKFLKTKQNDLN